jgi:hypothetical protein
MRGENLWKCKKSKGIIIRFLNGVLLFIFDEWERMCHFSLSSLQFFEMKIIHTMMFQIFVINVHCIVEFKFKNFNLLLIFLLYSFVRQNNERELLQMLLNKCKTIKLTKKCPKKLSMGDLIIEKWWLQLIYEHFQLMRCFDVTLEG